MTQSIKTLIFGAVAAASIAVAAGTYYSNQPTDIDAFSDVGDEFYPNFEDPNIATGLRVAAYNENTGKTEVFSVDVKDGVWRIPSHHDYPADGKERLAKTAASMVGVVREALVERTQSSQKRYDTLDPLDKGISGTEGRGDRITLYKGDEVLVDFIVGKKMENSPDLYYMRRADEERIYTADLGNFEVSTKFADWIQKDILTVEQNDIRELMINHDFVDETQGKVVSGDQIALSRETDRAEWKLDDLKPEEEKLKAEEVNNMLKALEELQIVGVRPKPAGLAAGLKSKDGAISIDPLIQRDLIQKGVFITGRGVFVYNEGKVNVGTQDGVFYELGFGEEFSGTDVDIEVGGQKTPAEEAEQLEKETAPENVDNKTDDEEKPEENDLKKSRYLFVTVLFNKSLLGPEPQKPTKPKKPQPVEEPADKPAEEASEEKPADDAAAAPNDAEAKPEEKKPDPEQDYQKALEEYEFLQEVYVTQKKSYDDRLKAGEEKVGELNARFADWYYVISEDVFDRLKLKRESLVEAVEKTEPETPEPVSPKTETPAAETAPEKPAIAPNAPPAPKAESSESSAAPAEKTEPATETPPAAEPPTEEPESAPAAE